MIIRLPFGLYATPRQRRRVSSKHPTLSTCASVPNAGRHVFTAGDDVFSIWTERDAGYASKMPRKVEQEAARYDVPHFCCRVSAATSKALSVGTKRSTLDDLGMSAKSVNFLHRFGVQQSQAVVFVTRHQHGTVGAERDRESVSFHYTKLLSGYGVPQSDLVLSKLAVSRRCPSGLIATLRTQA